MVSEKLVRIKNRIDTAANWAANNPILSKGEIGIEEDTNKIKIGNGTDSWNNTSYQNTGNVNYRGSFDINGTYNIGDIIYFNNIYGSYFINTNINVLAEINTDTNINGINVSRFTYKLTFSGGQIPWLKELFDKEIDTHVGVKNDLFFKLNNDFLVYSGEDASEIDTIGSKIDYNKYCYVDDIDDLKYFSSNEITSVNDLPKSFNITSIEYFQRNDATNGFYLLNTNGRWIKLNNNYITAKQTDVDNINKKLISVTSNVTDMMGTNIYKDIFLALKISSSDNTKITINKDLNANCIIHKFEYKSDSTGTSDYVKYIESIRGITSSNGILSKPLETKNTETGGNYRYLVSWYDVADGFLKEDSTTYQIQFNLEDNKLVPNFEKTSNSSFEGNGNLLIGAKVAHVEGQGNLVCAKYTHAEGERTAAVANRAHAEGNATVASGNSSHAEGMYSKCTGNYAHAEGNSTLASGGNSHSEGFQTTSSGPSSHAEGQDTIASGNQSHAEGDKSQATATAAHAEGYSTIASTNFQHVQGRNNIEDTVGEYAHIVGNGSSPDNRSNAHTLDWHGNAWYQGNIKIGGSSYDDTNAKEIATKEYVDSNASGGDRVYTYSSTDFTSKNFTLNIDSVDLDKEYIELYVWHSGIALFPVLPIDKSTTTVNVESMNQSMVKLDYGTLNLSTDKKSIEYKIGSLKNGQNGKIVAIIHRRSN